MTEALTSTSIKGEFVIVFAPPMNYYITTTLPYVNAKPHIGFALEIVQADALARYHRLRGEEVIFNTGTDEHGQKIYEKALEEGKEPKAYVDEYAAKFDALKEALNLSYTNFIQTSDPKHEAAAQEFWKRCEARGDIYKARYQVKYCVGCELEKTDSELVDNRCPVHPNLELQLVDEENYFFKFSNYQQPLLDLYDQHPDFVVPENRLREIKTFVEGGLKDFSISRIASKMPWGVPVPGDDAQVMYVWFDALVNYISTLGWPDESGAFACWPGVQVAGKDNLRQQSAMWQAMLLSAGVAPSKQIFIHGFITSGGQKMSKSLGNVVDPFDEVNEYGTDALRYYLLREIPSHDDGDFSRARMEERYAELANRLGNLVSRVASMSVKYFEGKLDDVQIDWSARQKALDEAIAQYDFKVYLDEVFKVIDEANEEVDKKEPFKLVKQDVAAAKQVLSEIAEQIRWIGTALAPVLPHTSEEILRRYGKVILVGESLFPRRDVTST
ncbi:MAG: Methionine-tRNA ligase [Candidatus Uhrbacteria bacterium GW2011_GWA2_52_8d]|uniref:Methionine--tRNA ligase n=1 Tax=Candidatus Uhrbacteria bacterium GW2011_GWA2_52_8d TaxID=1618979 RepID=A0A0G1XQ23_9BACT|nr:MAG: Methionine-tRNA ligase [Candidatus Uhrbacteria bacterium GW2011_GWA2_52_8d]